MWCVVNDFYLYHRVERIPFEKYCSVQLYSHAVVMYPITSNENYFLLDSEDDLHSASTLFNMFLSGCISHLMLSTSYTQGTQHYKKTLLKLYMSLQP